MFLPPSFSSILLKVLELPDQLFDCNALGTGAGREFAGELGHSALPLAAVEIGFLMADKGAGTLLGFERPLQFKLAIRPYHRVWINGKIDCQLPNRGKLIAHRKRPGRDGAYHLVHDLAVNRDATARIQGEWARASSLGSGWHPRHIVY